MKKISVILVVLFVISLLSGCGSGGGSDCNPSPTPTMSPTPGPTTSPTPSPSPTIVGIEIKTENTEFTADDIVPFQAFAVYSDDSRQDITSSSRLSWYSTDPNASFVGSVFEPYKAGQQRVWATFEGFTSNVVIINIAHGEIYSFAISPFEQQLTAGVPQQFTGTAWDSHFNKWDVTDQTSWQTTDPAGFITSAGIYTPGREGRWLVRGNYGGHASQTYVFISKNIPISITIEPHQHLLKIAGQTTSFSATAHDIAGNTWDISQIVSWYENDPLGSFEQYVYTAGAVGDWQIFASYQGLVSNSTYVTVLPGPMTGIIVSPLSQVVGAGSHNQFTATATDAIGNQWDVTSQVTWTTNDPTGSITSSGVYTPGTIGSWLVNADLSGINGQGTVTVIHNVATKIYLLPSADSVNAGGQVYYTLEAGDGFGNLWDVTDISQLTITAGAGGSWRLENHRWYYTAENTGNFTITANYDRFSDTALLTVNPALFTNVLIDAGNITGQGTIVKDGVPGTFLDFQVINGVLQGEIHLSPGTYTLDINVSGTHFTDTFTLTAGQISYISHPQP